MSKDKVGYRRDVNGNIDWAASLSVPQRSLSVPDDPSAKYPWRKMDVGDEFMITHDTHVDAMFKVVERWNKKMKTAEKEFALLKYPHGGEYSNIVRRVK